VNAQTNLLDTTLALVSRRGELVSDATGKGMTLRELAEGAGVDFEWLSKFSRGEITDPGVSKVQRVHDFLVPLIPMPRKRAAERARAS
jgi:hypothetical protein